MKSLCIGLSYYALLVCFNSLFCFYQLIVFLDLMLSLCFDAGFLLFGDIQRFNLSVLLLSDQILGIKSEVMALGVIIFAYICKAYYAMVIILEINDMEKKRLSVSFVGVFESQLSMIPQLDEEFCRKLFQAPYNTISGFSQEGFFIRLNNRPVPAIVINPQKIIVVAENRKLLYGYIKALNHQFLQIKCKEKINAFGLNYEYEWTNLEEDSNFWLWNHFIVPDIRIGNGYHACNKLMLKLGINDNEFVNLDIEPRTGMSKGIYVSINHHHNGSIEFLPEQQQLASLYESSLSLLEDDYFPNLIERRQV